MSYSQVQCAGFCQERCLGKELCVMRLFFAGSTRPESDMPVAFLAPELRARIWGLHRPAPIKHLQSPESYSATECTGVGIY